MGKSQNSAAETLVLAGPTGRLFLAAVPSREGGEPKRPPPGNWPFAYAQAQPHTTDELEPAEPAAPAGPTPHPGDIRARGRLRRARAWQDWGRRPEARRPGQRGPPRAYGPQRAVAKAAPRPGARPCRSPLNAATPRAFQGNTPVAQDGCHWPAIAGDPCRAAGNSASGPAGMRPGGEQPCQGHRVRDKARLARCGRSWRRLAPKKMSFTSLAVKFIACSVIQPVLLTGSQCSNPDLNCCDNIPA